MDQSLTHPLIDNAANWSDETSPSSNGTQCFKSRNSPCRHSGIHIPPIHRDNRSWIDRTFGELRPGSMRASVGTLASSAIGAGVLALPYSIVQMGVLLGCLSIFVAAAGALISLLTISFGMKATNVDNYGALVGGISNRNWKVAVDIFITLNALGTCVSYMVFLGDFLPSALEAFYVPSLLRNRELVLVCCFFIMLPFCCKQKLSSLRHLTVIPISALGFTCVAMILYSGSYMLSHHTAGHGLSLTATYSPNTFKGFNVCIFAFMQHVNVCPVVTEMTRPSDRRVIKTMFKTICLEAVLYIIVAVTTITTFGTKTQQNVLQNYPYNSGVIVVCRLLMSLSMIVSMPLNVVPATNSILYTISSILGRSSSDSIPRSDIQVTESPDKPRPSQTLSNDNNSRSSRNSLKINLPSFQISSSSDTVRASIISSTRGSLSPLAIDPGTQDPIGTPWVSPLTVRSTSSQTFFSCMSEIQTPINVQIAIRPIDAIRTGAGLIDNTYEVPLNTSRASQLTASELTASQLTASELTASELTASQLTASQLTASELTASQLTASELTECQLAHSNATAMVYRDCASSARRIFDMCTADEVAYINPEITPIDGLLNIIWLRNMIATIFMVIVLAIGLSTDKVADVISFVGGIFVTTLMFLFPAIILSRCHNLPAFADAKPYVHSTVTFLVVVTAISYFSVLVVVIRMIS